MARERRMNILFINSNREWGGGEVWLATIAAEMSRRGHRVVIVCRPGSALRKKLSGQHESVIPLRLSGDFNPATVLRLCTILVKQKISLVCVHTEKELRIAGMAGTFARIPVVVSQDVDVPVKNSYLNRLFYGKIASAIMVNSYATRNTLLSAAPWLQTQRIHVVWKGVDLQAYGGAEKSRIREDLKLAADDTVAGFVGRLDEQKGIPTLLEAVRFAVKRDPRFRLLIAGEGNLKEYIRDYSSRHNLNQNIFLVGFIQHIPSLLQAVDFIVVPSYWEGFCYSALEAMAAGKAVVGSNTSSIPELVVHNSTGILVPPRSPEDLAGAIGAISSQPSLREEMGQRGRDRAQRLFPSRIMHDKTEEFFQTAIEAFHHRNSPNNSRVLPSAEGQSIPVLEMIKDDSLHFTR